MTADGRWVAALEARARSVLPGPVFEYLQHGARDGLVAARAAAAWTDVELWPRVLRDVREVTTEVTLLGHRQLLPFGVAPTTLQRAVHPEGEVAMARAIAAHDGLMVVSSNAGTPFDDIAATGVRWWVQCYLPQQRGIALPLLERAVDAGAGAVVLTVDTPVVATKYAATPTVWDVVDPALLRVNFDPGYDERAGNEKARDISADDIAWLARVTGLPVVVKGVLHPADARAALDGGAAAVWVSTHGGRQLDRTPSSATALRAVRTALGDAAEVYVDGGIRSGVDVVAAHALGADAVFLGRQPVYALVDGEPGVRQLCEVLAHDVEETLRLCGARRPAETRGMAAHPL